MYCPLLCFRMETIMACQELVTSLQHSYQLLCFTFQDKALNILESYLNSLRMSMMYGVIS